MKIGDCIMKIKISNIVTNHASCPFFNGILRIFKQYGFNVELISSPGHVLNQVANEEGATPIGIPMEREISLIKDTVSLWKLYRYFLSNKPTIVNAGTGKAGLLSMVASTIAGIPIRILQERGLRLETTTGLKFWILWLAEKIACFCAHRVICNSKSLAKRLIDLRLVAPEKISVLHHGSSRGVNSVRFKITGTELIVAQRIQQELGISTNQIILGYIGRITRDKGIKELFEAFKITLEQYPDLYLLLVGQEENGDPVPQIVLAEMKSHPKISFIGESSHVIPYYHLIDIFVFPSYREGFPNVVLEASSMGLPIVGTRATGVIDAIVHEKTGLTVNIKDSVALTEGILYYLQNPTLRIQHGLNARRRTIEFFQLQSIWDAYYNLIKELLEWKKIPIPEPITPLMSLPEVDLNADELRTRTWLAVKQHLLHEESLEIICKMFQVNSEDLKKLVNEIYDTNN
jgi:glycosyltransferase involved in cell wall biosynthesis